MSEKASEVAVRTPAEIAVAEQHDVPGMEGFSREDLVVPRLRLVQAQSDFDKSLTSEHHGMIYNTLTGSTKSKLHAFVIGARKSRIKWPPGGYQRDQEPQCASDDGMFARDGMSGADGTGTPTNDCSRCVYQRWDDRSDEPPACALTFNFLVVDIDDRLPALISFSRTSARAGRGLVSMLKQYQFRRSYRIEVAAESNKKGKYFVYIVKMGDEIPPERQVELMSLAEEYRRVKVSAEDDAEREPPADNATRFDPDELERQRR